MTIDDGLSLAGQHAGRGFTGRYQRVGPTQYPTSTLTTVNLHLSVCLHRNYGARNRIQQMTSYVKEVTNVLAYV